MQLNISKNNEKISLLYNGNVIEEYTMTNTIDFSKLVNFLLADELKELIKLEIDDFERSIQDQTLINLIQEITNEYNKKVKDYIEFVNKHQA